MPMDLRVIARRRLLAIPLPEGVQLLDNVSD